MPALFIKESVPHSSGLQLRCESLVALQTQDPELVVPRIPDAKTPCRNRKTQAILTRVADDFKATEVNV